MSTPFPFSYNDTVFREQFPQFSNPTTFPESQLLMYWTLGNTYVANSNYGSLYGPNRQYALDLMGAHLAAVNVIISGDNYNAILYVPTGATIDKVSLTLKPPPTTNGWQWWLSTTPYGQQLLALLQAHSAGGFYVASGPPERSSIRKAWGTFSPPWNP